jgi:hypothetical protein
MTSYAKPSLFKVLKASYSNDGNVFGVDKMFFLRSPNNLVMKALDAPWVRQQFNIKKVTDKLDNVEPSNRGILDVSSIISWMGPYPFGPSSRPTKMSSCCPFSALAIFLHTSFCSISPLGVAMARTSQGFSLPFNIS